MQTIELANTGVQVSRLALGAMLMGTATDEESSRTILDRYLDAGGNFVDTANCYAWWVGPGCQGGESEELLGRWFADGRRRDEVFLATKAGAWVRDPVALRAGPSGWADLVAQFEGAGAGTLRRAVDGSLRRLGTDHVDLLYVHVDDLVTPLEETLEALAGIVAAGKARYLGWSNVRTWRLERIRGLCERNGWPAPVAVQQQHSYLRPRAGAGTRSIVSDEQLDYLRSGGELTLVAYSAILKGIYDNPAKRREHEIMDDYAGQDADARLAALGALASELDVTPGQLVIAWLLHQTSPAPIALVGPRTVEQYEATMAAIDIKLTGEQLARLDAAGAE